MRGIAQLGVFLLLVLVVAACDGVYRITVEMPWCPMSDSAKRLADSVPVLCLLADTSQDTTP